MVIPAQPFGFVAGRWVLSLADTPMDADRAPDYKPLFPGSVIFNNKLSHRVVGDGQGGTIGIVKTRYEAKLNEDGKLVDAEENEFVALPVGIYSVTFSFGQYSWPAFDIEVKPEHTVDSPLWLPTESPHPSGPGVVHVVSEATRIAAEDAAVRSESAAVLSGESALISVAAAAGVEALDTLRVDTSVGTRIFATINGSEYMLHGDTGWRDIRSLLNDYWQVSGSGDHSYAQLRRVGNTVTITARVAYVETTETHNRTSNTYVLSSTSIPTGFRSDRTYVPSTMASWGGGFMWSDYTTMGNTQTTASSVAVVFPSLTGPWIANQAAAFSVQWTTRQAWPTELPGTPL